MTPHHIDWLVVGCSLIVLGCVAIWHSKRPKAKRPFDAPALQTPDQIATRSFLAPPLTRDQFKAIEHHCPHCNPAFAQPRDSHGRFVKA